MPFLLLCYWEIIVIFLRSLCEIMKRSGKEKYCIVSHAFHVHSPTAFKLVLAELTTYSLSHLLKYSSFAVTVISWLETVKFL